MKFCWVLVVVGVIGGGCDRGGVLTGSGGAGQLTGLGGAAVGAGGGGGSQVIVVTGGGGAAASGGIGGFVSACGVVPPATPLAPDILIVLDTSTSMNDGIDGPCGTAGCGASSKWAMAVSAINTVVAMPTPAVNWGLTFVAGGIDVCDPGGVLIAAGASDAAGIRWTLSSRSSGDVVLLSPGNTPAAYAVGVAATSLAARPTIGPHIILLVTDGEPDCAFGASDHLASDRAGAVQSITHAASIGIPTYVVGMVITSGSTSATLTEMAKAGGLAIGYTSAGSAADLVAAMNVLVSDMTCAFVIPPPPTSYTSRSNIGVRLDDVDIPQDAANGWTYADATQTAVKLHGTACATALAGEIVYVYFRCLLP